MRNVIALSIVCALIVIIALLVFAPVVPFEQLQSAQVPAGFGETAQIVCPPNSSCFYSGLDLKQVWVKSYGSLAFEAFGIGISPFSSPVKVTIGNITNVYMFNSSGFVVETFAYPSSVKSEPVPLINVESATLLSGAMQASGVSVKLVNNGVGENASVYVWPTGSQQLASAGQTIESGKSVTYNITSWTRELPVPKVGDHISFEISGQLCYGKDCFSYENFAASKVMPEPGTKGQPTIKGISGPVWLVGAMSTDPSALPNTGVRSTIEVIDAQTPGSLAFWVSDGMPNHIWGQVGYFLSGGGQPVGFYQVWNLNSDILITSGTASIDTGNHTFSMYLQNGTTWAYAIDGNVFGIYDMGASSSSLTYPVYAMSEEEANTTFSFPAVSFGPALEVLRSGSWSSVQSASVYGTTWGVEGSIQNNKLGANQMIVSGSLGGVPQGTLLWGASTISSTSDSLASLPISARAQNGFEGDVNIPNPSLTGQQRTLT